MITKDLNIRLGRPINGINFLNDIDLEIESQVLSGKAILKLLPEITTLNWGENYLQFSNKDFSGGFLQLPFDKNITQRVQKAYEDILKTTQSNRIARIWNFIPNINSHEFGEETYKLFNKGRDNAVRKCNVKNMPAATGIDIHNKKISILYLCTNGKVQHFRNPEQDNPKDYPKQYGKQPPRFSRATTVTHPTYKKIFISGTSSIKNHQTLHYRNIESQLATTLDNIAIMRKECDVPTTSQSESITYLRHKKHLPIVKQYLEKYEPELAQTTSYVLANICRSDLDVEIEQTFTQKL